MSSEATKGPLSKHLFEHLFKTYYPSLKAFSKKLLKDDDTAKDIVHMVFMNLWEKRNTVNEQEKIKSYLFRSVHNRSLNHIRDQKKFAEPSAYEQWDDANNHIHSRDFLEERELEEKINTAIDSLPQRCRQIFMLSRFEDKKYAEIAQELNISIKTVEAQMGKALHILREQLSDYMYMMLLFILFDKFI